MVEVELRQSWWDKTYPQTIKGSDSYEGQAFIPIWFTNASLGLNQASALPAIKGVGAIESEWILTMLDSKMPTFISVRLSTGSDQKGWDGTCMDTRVVAGINPSRRVIGIVLGSPDTYINDDEFIRAEFDSDGDIKITSKVLRWHRAPV